MSHAEHRRIVVATALKDHDALAVQFAVESVRRTERDVIDLVHVVCAREEPQEVFHSVPGTSVGANDPTAVALEAQAIEGARKALRERYTDAMDEQQIPHNLHLFVDTSNAPNSEIFKSISSVCENVHADVLVLAAYKKGMIDRALSTSIQQLALDSTCTKVVVFV